MEQESKSPDTGLARTLAEIIGLFAMFTALDLLIIRSLAQASRGFETSLILAAGNMATVYFPLLLLAWILLRIWRHGNIQEAHRFAAVTSLALAFLTKGLLAYTIVSGFSNP